jgi:hypothetical protein
VLPKNYSKMSTRKKVISFAVSKNICYNENNQKKQTDYPPKQIQIYERSIP